jgi:hypothetical protein
MHLQRRSAFFVLLIAIGCGPNGAAFRAPDSAAPDGGGFGSGGSPSLPSGVAGAGGAPGTGGRSPAVTATGGATSMGGSQAPAGGNGTGGSVAPAPGTGGSDGLGTGGDSGSVAPPDGGTGEEPTGPIASATPPSAADLLARLTACQELTQGRYPTDDGASGSVAVCGLPDAIFWKADMDINCNGKSSSVCNANVDPGYRSSTAGKDSLGGSLDAATLPFVVIPGASTRFDFTKHGVAVGSVVAVIFKGQVEYGVIGEVGATGIIGEASYAMAKALGIDPDPATGGTGSGVTYLVFKGPSAIPAKLEDRAETVRIGKARALELLR